MRTFHTGGVAGDDITHGLPRVVELFEARTPKGVAPIAEAAGRVTIEDTDKTRRIVLTPDDGSEEIAYPVSRRSRLLVAGRRPRRGRHPADPGCDRPEAGAAHPRPARGADAPGRRGPGGLPQPGCVDPRQAHRGHRPADAAPGDDHRVGRRRPAAGRARRALAASRTRTAGWCPRAARRPPVVPSSWASPRPRSRPSRGCRRPPSRRPPGCSPRRRSTAKSDPLLGLKENVILGKLIPAGTGLPRYRNIRVEPTEEAKAAMYSMPGYEDLDFAPFGPGSGQAVPLEDLDLGRLPLGRYSASTALMQRRVTRDAPLHQCARAGKHRVRGLRSLCPWRRPERDQAALTLAGPPGNLGHRARCSAGCTVQRAVPAAGDRTPALEGRPAHIPRRHTRARVSDARPAAHPSTTTHHDRRSAVQEHARDGDSVPTIQQLVRKGRQDKVSKTKTPALKGQPAAARRVHARLHDHPQEAELRAAQGRPRPPDQRHRGHGVHPGCRPQPAGALDRARARRPCEGPARVSATRSSVARSTPRVSRTASRLAAVTARRRRRADASQGTRPEAAARRRPGLPVARWSPSWSTRSSLDGKKSVAETIVYGALEGCREKTGTDPVADAQARARQRQADPRGQVPPRRWRDLPGAGRGQGRTGPTTLALRWLVGYSRAASREDDDRAPHERDPRREQRPRCRGQASRGHPQDGRVQQGLRALPLVMPGLAPAGRRAPRAGPLTPTQPTQTRRERHRGTGRADGPHEGPQHRHHGAHRRRQDHDDRADPLLHRDQLQDR